MLKDEHAILVIGGTGHYGQTVVNSLLQKQVKVKILSRCAEKARDIFDHKSLEIVEGNIQDEKIFEKTLADINSIIISLSAFNRESIRDMRDIEYNAVVALLEAARKKGIERVVYISVYDIYLSLARKLNLKTALVKHEMENYIKSSSFNWTILGAPASMDVFFSMTIGSRMIVPGGGPDIFPCVCKKDVGEITAQTVIRNDLNGKRIRLPGPGRVNFYKAAEIISRYSGKTIKVKKLPLIFPVIVSKLLFPFTWLSPTLLYVRNIMLFARMMNRVPEAVTNELEEDQKFISKAFQIEPTTLESEVKRRF